jgi:chromosomal replication initiation ATPase DnaA
MNLSYNTKQASTYIFTFIKENRYLLNLSSIERKAGIPDHKLIYFSLGRKKTLHPIVIKKLIPVLEGLNFRMPCIEFTVEEVLRSVSYSSGMKIEVIKSRSRKREIVQERQIAMYLCSVHGKNKSGSLIAKEFGDYDPNTVRHANKTINNLCETDKFFREKVDNYEKELLNK